MSDSLPSLIEQRFTLMKTVFESDGEIESELEVLIKENSLSLVEKVDRVAAFLKMAPKYAESLRSEANELLEAARSIEGRAARLKAFVKDSMVAHGTPKLIGETWTLNVQATAGSLRVQEGVNLLDDIPERFVDVQTTVNLAAVKSEWETLPESVKKYFVMTEGSTLIPRPNTKRKIK